jgi:hypothetical protein
MRLSPAPGRGMTHPLTPLPGAHRAGNSDGLPWDGVDAAPGRITAEPDLQDPGTAALDGRAARARVPRPDPNVRQQ